MSCSPTKGYQVHFAPGIYEQMLASVGALEPEHYAVLGGYLDNPFHVTDFMPMPPPLDQRGGYRASSATVTLNGPFIEYYLNTCLTPFGKYIVGVMHSHPSGLIYLSDGAPGSGYGDIPSMRAHLQAAKRYGEPWHNFIAPIVTYPGRSPQVHTWILRLDTPQPIAAETIWETKATPASPPAAAFTELDEILDLVRYRPELVRSILRRGDKLNGLLRSHSARDERDALLLMRRVSQNQMTRRAMTIDAHKSDQMTPEELVELIMPLVVGRRR